MLSRQASDLPDDFPGAVRGFRVVGGEFAELDISGRAEDVVYFARFQAP